MSTIEAIRSHELASHPVRLGGAMVNVGHSERLASKLGGGVLVGVGLMRGGLTGLVTAGIGGLFLYRAATGYCGFYKLIGANTADEEERGAEDSVPAQAGIRVDEVTTIGRSPQEVYRFWRDYANLPRFMEDIRSVTSTTPDGKRSHWVAEGPGGATLEWDSELIEDRPGALIAWRSTAGQVESAGSVHFTPAPGGKGTEVRINQKINPPGGKIGAAISTLLGHGPRGLTMENLRRLKQIMEAGEVVTTIGQPSGTA